MHDAYFYGNTDIAEIILSIFVLFFFGLVVYLRREDRPRGLSARGRRDRAPRTAGRPVLPGAPEDFHLAAWRGYRGAARLCARRARRRRRADLQSPGDSSGADRGSHARGALVLAPSRNVRTSRISCFTAPRRSYPCGSPKGFPLTARTKTRAV